MGVTFALEVGFFSAMGILVGQLGTVQLAAHQISLQMSSLSFMGPLGHLDGGLHPGRQSRGRGGRRRAPRRRDGSRSA